MLSPRHCVLTGMVCATLLCSVRAQAGARPEHAAQRVLRQTRANPCIADQPVPDPACTPGAVLTTDTTAICKSGYTKTIRDVPLAQKKQVFEEYGIPWSLHSKYEVDHLISLELGGSNDLANLWPQSSMLPNGSKTKDQFENYLHTQICGEKIPIQKVQHELATNWLTYYNDWLSTTRSADRTRSSTALKRASPTKTAAGPAVKKSSANICHEKGTRSYARTTHFTPYNSLQECLQSGGRLPVR